jgi:hypothetical protein
MLYPAASQSLAMFRFPPVVRVSAAIHCSRQTKLLSWVSKLCKNIYAEKAEEQQQGMF